MNGVEIRQVRYDAIVSQALVAAAMAELGQRYGGSGDDTLVSPAEFEPPNGAFLVAYLGTEAVACGGWRSWGEGGEVAELKRMYTAPVVRRSGVARRMLEAIEESARSSGRTRIILECGDRQPEAVAFYRTCGYRRIEDFGHYRDAPGVVSFGRALS